MLVFDIFDKIIKIDESMILFFNCNTGSDVVDNTLKVIIHVHKAKITSITPSFKFLCKERLILITRNV